MLSGLPQPHPCWAHGWMLSGFGPLPRRKHPASASMASGGAVTFLSSEGKPRNGQTNFCCCLQLRKLEAFISLSEPATLPVSIVACQTSAATPSSAQSCWRVTELTAHPAPALWDWEKCANNRANNCANNCANGAQEKSEQPSAVGCCLQTHMAALFPNQRVNEEMLKDLKVNWEQRDWFCKLLKWTLD